MIKTTERRMAILHILSERRKERIENLAFELGVCRNTIQRDIEILSLSFPIYTSQGVGGGIYVVEGFHLGTKYLTDSQCELLERLLEMLEGADKETLHIIIKTFRKPNIKGKK